MAKTSTKPAKTAPKVEAPRSRAFSVRANKAAEKLRNLSSAELEHKQRELQDQLFRLKFQLRMGQTESLKKIRGLRRDVARVKTIAHGRALGAEPGDMEKK